MKNKPHFYLPFIAAMFYIPFVFWFFIQHSFWLWVIGNLIVTSFVYWYETRQVLDPDEVEKHGGIILFRRDSRDDIRKAFFGTWIGQGLGFVIYIVIFKLF